jgi:hypothetical protein
MKRFLVAVPVLVGLLSLSTAAQSVATAELHVTVKDPSGRLVTTAKVTVRDESRGIERALENMPEGDYRFLSLPPGQYTVTVEAAGFARATALGVRVTVGQSAELPVTLSVSGHTTEVTVSGETEMVETQQTSVSTTINQMRIDNLPINGRSYINFTLTDSRVSRDNTPNIPTASTSGLNFSGSRARANLVNVDGEDAVDNSVNGIRSTVSQEAVQEFQIIDNSYAAEYGRASGGVVNIITRAGTNNLHGTAFGYLRNRNIQADNPFTNVPGPAYTRVQAGATLGGAIRKNKTFYFFSYETTRRHETGFSNIGANDFDLVPYDTSALTPVLAPALAPLGISNFGTVLLTSDQVAFLNTLGTTFAALPAPVRAAALPVLAPQAVAYLTLTGGASGIALNRAFPSPAMYFTASQIAGVPVNPGCAVAPQNCPVFPETAFALPPTTSFFGLNSVKGNFPVTEGTSIVSLRLDHHLNSNQTGMVRVSVSPSTQTGLQANAQGPQNFGQNSFSRTSQQTFRDVNSTAQHTWSIGNNKVNEFRFQYARRGLLFNFASAPGGSAVADQIPGFAFIGREPFSFVRRTEQRYQFTDNFSISHGSHTFKFGGDFHYLPLVADFTVNFGGVYNFGGLPASLLLNTSSITLPGSAPIPIPAFSPVQAYGLGFPQNFIQGVGNPHDEFANKILSAFIQDSWHIKSNLTLNYGVRYDVEFTPTFQAINATAAAAEQALGIGEGIRQDLNNVAPRIGLAWSPGTSGKTVVRASYGLFYDHPLLALAFDSDVADGSQAPQFGLLFGSPGCGSSAATAVNAVNTFQGILAKCPVASVLNYLPLEQRFNPAPNAPSAFVGQQFLQLGLPMTFLPDGFPVASNFQYAYANQANLSVERDLGRNFALSLQYNFSGGRHLNRPIDSNPTNPVAMATNFKNCLADPICTAQPLTALGPQFAGFGGTQPCNVGPGGPWVAAPIMNFFRIGGMNPSFVPALQAAGAPGLACLALANQLLASYGLGVKDSSGNYIPVPFNAMGANYSDGSSVYHGFSVNLRKRMSNHYEFLASYTWSHAIDDSTDLETPLAVQDPFHPNRDRSNSLFDQRHRFVFSAVYQSARLGGSGFVSKLFSDWTLAPIVEFNSGRPFNIISGEDTNLDGRTTTDRPNAVSGNAGPNCNGELPVASRFSPTGFFQPACFNDANFGDGTFVRNGGVKPTTIFSDLRVARRIRLGERLNLDGIMDVFNIPNRFNVADVNPLWNQAGQATSAFDPRQFQFALKLTW